MIKRQYFISAKIAHNDNSGEYSYYNGVLNTIGWFENKDNLLHSARDCVHSEIAQIVKRVTSSNDVELLSLNKI